MQSQLIENLKASDMPAEMVGAPEGPRHAPSRHTTRPPTKPSKVGRPEDLIRKGLVSHGDESSLFENPHSSLTRHGLTSPGKDRGAKSNDIFEDRGSKARDLLRGRPNPFGDSPRSSPAEPARSAGFGMSRLNGARDLLSLPASEASSAVSAVDDPLGAAAASPAELTFEDLDQDLVEYFDDDDDDFE